MRNNLDYIGILPIGMQRVRFSRCRDCGAYYPWFTAMDETGHPIEPQETTGPMLNGMKIFKCPCAKRTEKAGA